jgi:hypothetical protein
MNEPDVNRGLQQEDLFELFRLQLKKDFESCGIDSAFTDGLPAGYDALRKILLTQVEKLFVTGSQYFAGLLYRVDISEKQLARYSNEHQELNLAETITELIIKRTLQKVILKKRFSE